MIIKCPECGHQVSDKAPVCPSCGVEIAGNIIKCSNCGELYLKEEGICPNCHHVESAANPAVKPQEKEPSSNDEKTETEVNLSEADIPAEIIAEPIEEEIEAVQPLISFAEQEKPQPVAKEANAEKANAKVGNAPKVTEKEKPSTNRQAQNTPKKRSHLSLLIAVLIAAITGFILLLAYNRTNPTTEKQEYDLAIKSNDTTLLRQYLDNYPTASASRRQEVESLLNRLTTKNPADNWESTVKTNTKQAYTAFLSHNPNSPHKAEAVAKIDEIDWTEALGKNSENGYLAYVTMHPNGIHKAEADEKLKGMLVHTASKADQEKAVACIRQLLIGMNTKSKDKISGVVASQINFLGSPGATTKDIFQYMTDKLYQADVKTINWHLSSPAEVINIEGDEGGVEIKVPAKLVIEREGGTSSKSYLVKAKIKGGRIYLVNWNQL